MTKEKCHFCTETERLQNHHIVPRRYNGSDNAENIVTVCPTCHDKLEALYNKRFYRELGVETASRELGECVYEDCTAKAARSIQDHGTEMVSCKYHYECDFGGCTKTPDHILNRSGGGHGMACDDHAVCSYNGCQSRDTEVYEDEFRDRAYCRLHATEASID